MAHKTIGEGSLVEGWFEFHDSIKEFDEIDKMIKWYRLEKLMKRMYSSKEGRPAYPPLMMFKCLLLQQWHDLSDPDMEKHLGRDLAFRRFVGLALEEDVPDYSTLSRFRKELMLHGLADKLFDEINKQIDKHGLIVRKGTLMDATIIEAPNGKRKLKDHEARGTVKRDKPYYGYKLHIGTDEGSDLIRKVHVTTAEVNDGRVSDNLLSGDERAVYADKAYHSKKRIQEYRKKNIHYGILRRCKKKSLPKDYGRKSKIYSAKRSAVERPFAWLKRHFNYTKTKYMGFARNRSHMFLLCTALNLKRAAKMLSAKAAPT